MDVDVEAGKMLSQDEVQVIVSLERAGASLSLIGVILIFITFAIFKKLRTVPNTFILFASFANVGASVASLIGYAGIAAGVDSHLCRAQAFLLEMFMQSDPWWSFAMAINVYMVFFFSANPTVFRRYLWAYCLVCFGLPMVPAIVCLHVKTDRGPIYGDATLWCWIGNTWNSLRIFTYYIPIWMCIALSAVIYMAVGYHVFHQRNQLRNLTLSNQGKDVSTSDVRDSAEKNLTGPPSVYPTVTHEIQVTHDVYDTFATPPPTPSPSATAQCPWAAGPYDEELGSTGGSSARSCTATGLPRPAHTFPPVTSNIITAIAPRRPARRQGPQRAWGRLSAKLKHMDPVKLAYLRTSFVFAVSVLVTWTPSSINRVYNLIYPDRVSYGLNLASAVVLPLQGVWNAVIYFTTSWRTLKEEVPRTWRLQKLRWSGGMPIDGVRQGSVSSSRGRQLDERACGMSTGGRRTSHHHFHGDVSFGRTRGHVPLDSGELEMSPRVKLPPPVGTLRVQKGCDLDGL